MMQSHRWALVSAATNLACARVLPVDTRQRRRIEWTCKVAVYFERLSDRGRHFRQCEPHARDIGPTGRPLHDCVGGERTLHFDGNATDRVPDTGSYAHEMERLLG